MILRTLLVSAFHLAALAAYAALVVVFVPLAASAQMSDPELFVLRDADKNGVPDQVQAMSSELKGYVSCYLESMECGVSITAMYLPPKSRIRIRTAGGCPARRIVLRATERGTLVRQLVPVTARAKCMFATQQ